MGELPVVIQHPFCGTCPWHSKGRDYCGEEIFAGACPILYHSLYPYFLGLLYHADMQDIWVCCPAETGVDVLVRREEPNRSFGHIPPDYWVIYAEVVKVGACPHGYEVGMKILFPTAYKEQHMCPAGVNNIFKFMNMKIPECINMKKLRCPDWKNTVHYSLEDEWIK